MNHPSPPPPPPHHLHTTTPSTQMSTPPPPPHPPPPPPPSTHLIPGLPNDVSLLCLARIPRSDHPTISLVCKTWKSTLNSHALYATRSLLHISQPFLYLNLRIHNNFSWYVLIHKTPTKHVLVKLPSLPIQSVINPPKNQLVRNGFDAKSTIGGSSGDSKSVQLAGLQKRELIGTDFDVKSTIEGSYGNLESAHLIDLPKSQLIGMNLAGNSEKFGHVIGTNLGVEMPIEASSSGNLKTTHLIDVSKSRQIGTNLAVQTPIEDASGDLKNAHLNDVQKRQQIGTNLAVQTPVKANEKNSYVKVEPFGLSHLIYVPKRQPIGPSFAVLGSSIYMIGGSNDEISSNSVWVFDCRFNVWEMGPKMRVGREFSAAGVVDGKIYVMGGCVVDNWARSMNWAEVFDPVKGEWAPVPSPIEVRDKWMHASAVIGGKLYAMADRGGVVYDVRKGEWGSVTKRLDLGWRGRAAVVGGVLYCYDYLGKIRGYDVGEDRWKELRGVEKGLPKFLCGATMVNFDGRLCVVWEGKGSGKEVEIMCAEIEVKKDVDGGLSGVILWSDVILLVPNSASIVQCLVVEV